tara:strand:- start:645 stop:1646 length:1002 start_codon:yes stop_codon:yes gene_type:complete
MKLVAQSLFFLALLVGTRVAAEPISTHELVPLPNHEVSFQIEGSEKLRWHFGKQYPRPFFYPFKGPSGASLTRMGHPGAQNHDHHRSIWFAHNDLNGVNFWSDSTTAKIRQKMWLSYHDGDEEAIMASLLGWFDGEGVEVMEQELVTSLRVVDEGEHALEIQITLRPAKEAKTVELGKTNFGFLAVRVAKSISEYFGEGLLTNSEGQIHEAEIFGNPARWMDYSGPVAIGTGSDRKTVVEGITYFDHPSNPRYPTKWHVRQDGWMGASFGMDEAFTISHESPLVLRYLLHAHQGAYDAEKAGRVASDFHDRPGFVVQKRTKRHGQFDVLRIPK